MHLLNLKVMGIWHPIYTKRQGCRAKSTSSTMVLNDHTTNKRTSPDSPERTTIKQPKLQEALGSSADTFKETVTLQKLGCFSVSTIRIWTFFREASDQTTSRTRLKLKLARPIFFLIKIFFSVSGRIFFFKTPNQGSKFFDKLSKQWREKRHLTTRASNSQVWTISKTILT